MGNNAVGGVGNNRGSVDKGSGVDGVGNNGSVDSVGNDGSSVDGVGNHRGSGNVATSRGRGVDSLTRVRDLSCKHKCKNTNTEIQLRKYKYRPM